MKSALILLLFLYLPSYSAEAKFKFSSSPQVSCSGAYPGLSLKTSYCDSMAFLSRDLRALNDLSELLGDGEQVVFFGDTHPNIYLKRWLALHLADLKKNGFTHIGLEALNTESQPLVDAYLSHQVYRRDLVQLISSEWGWIPEEHVDLIDAISAAGLRVVALDNRNELDRQGFGNDIQKRNEHMTGAILQSLASPNAGRMAVLTGKRHSSWVSDEPNVFTLPQMINSQGVRVLSWDLESGEELAPKFYVQAFLDLLKKQPERSSKLGDFYVRTQHEGDVDGVVFIQYFTK